MVATSFFSLTKNETLLSIITLRQLSSVCWLTKSTMRLVTLAHLCELLHTTRASLHAHLNRNNCWGCGICAKLAVYIVHDWHLGTKSPPFLRRLSPRLFCNLAPRTAPQLSECTAHIITDLNFSVRATAYFSAVYRWSLLFGTLWRHFEKIKTTVPTTSQSQESRSSARQDEPCSPAWGADSQRRVCNLRSLGS